jgi:putative ABC transport system substrate-binding protein
MKRRQFITLLGGAALWPLAARAQQGNRVRRIGVLVTGVESASNLNVSAFTRALAGLGWFTRALAGLGWTDGPNVRIDLRWGDGDINRIRALAQKLVGLQPDIILTGGTAATSALQRPSIAT